VLVLLTEKWAPCIPYLQLLSLVGLMFPLHVMNLNVLQALGRSDLFLRLEIIKKALIVVNIAITWRWGIMAMIAGQVVTSMASYYLNAYYNRALLNYSIWEQIGDMYPYLLNASLMGAAVYAMSHLPIASPAVLLICQVTAGISLYVFLCRIFRNAAYMNMQEMLFRRLPFQAIQ
jgi:teichuronic acid exporter